MNDISSMYQELIIDHARAPKNFGKLVERTHHACGHNPLCGDAIDMDLQVANNIIEQIAWNGDGCAISKASASLMTERVKGKAVSEALRLFDAFHQLLTTDGEDTSLGKLQVLQGVRNFPMRVKCATLAWHTLHAALSDQEKRVSTE